MSGHLFEEWWETYGSKYQAAVIERGGTPWTADLAERRALWQRRHNRPSPPLGLSNDPAVIRGGSPASHRTEGIAA